MGRAITSREIRSDAGLAPSAYSLLCSDVAFWRELARIKRILTRIPTNRDGDELNAQPQSPSTESIESSESPATVMSPTARIGRAIFVVLILGASLVFLASVAFFIFDLFGHPPGV